MMAFRPPGRIETSGGEPATESRTRGGSLVEVVAVFGVLQVALWLGAGQPPAPGETVPWLRTLGVVMAALAAAYALFAAPHLHGDSRHDRGLPDAHELRRLWPQLTGIHRMMALALVLALPCLLLWAGWEPALIRLGLRRTWPAFHGQLLSFPWRQVGQIVAAVALGGLFASLLIRWGNLQSAARALLWPTALMLAVATGASILVAGIDGNWERLGSLRPAGDGLGWIDRFAVYVPWALVQQWLLLGYFNTRIRKLVPSAGWRGLSGRSFVAGLTGAAFALMHAPALTLMGFTLAAGTIWGWLFQHDRSRNLFVIAVAHAAAGSALVALTGMTLMVGR